MLDLNIDVAEQEVQAAINAAGTYLPSDLPIPPIYSKINPADAPILTLALTSETLPLSKVEDLADTRLAQKISQLPGVGLVSISGGQKPAVRVQVNPTALSSYGLTLEDLRTAIAQAQRQPGQGQLRRRASRYTIGANDQLLSGAQYRPLIVAYRNGAPVRLSDVANVVDDVENVRQAAWMNQHAGRHPQHPAPARRQHHRGRRSDQDAAAAARAPRCRRRSRSRSSPTARRPSAPRSTTCEFELMLTIGLVVMVIFLFLRTTAGTIIPSVAVPLSLVGTFGVMYLLGYSLNNLTLMALTISTGFVVDDAIVMIENIFRYIEEGEPPLEAALKGSAQIGFTILSLTVSLIAVLIPLLFMGDIVGRLFREFAVTLCGDDPDLGGRVADADADDVRQAAAPEARRRSRAVLPQLGARVRPVIAFYGRTLTWVLKHQTATLLVAVATLVSTVLLYVVIPKGFFPVQDTGVILGISEAPQTISFAAMAERQQALARRDPQGSRRARASRRSSASTAPTRR